MKKVIALFVLMGICFMATSCSLDDGQNFRFTTLKVTKAKMPESFEFNKTYNIEVTYIRPNACTFFEGFDVNRTGETNRDIAIVGTVIDDPNTACTQAIEEVVATLQFSVIFTGEYKFRFYAGQDESNKAQYLEYTVPVK